MRTGSWRTGRRSAGTGRRTEKNWLFEPFAERTIHSKIISTVVNVIDKPGTDEDRIALPFDPNYLRIIDCSEAFRKHKLN